MTRKIMRKILLTFLRHITLLTNATRLVFFQDGGTLLAFFADLSGKISTFKPTIKRNCYQISNKKI